MKIVYFIPLLSTTGGQERTLIDKANYLVGMGHEVIFVTYEHEGQIAYPMDPLVKHIDINCHFFSIYKYPFYKRIFIALKQKRVFREKMKEVLSHFCPNVLVLAIPNTENYICDVLSVAQGVPVVIESHLAQGYQVVKRGWIEKLLCYYYNPIRAIRKAKLLISLTEGDAVCWQRHMVHNIKVIPNPLTFYSETSFVEKLRGRIVCVGRLAPQKRFDRLVDAFYMISDRYPEWYVDIYGEGEDKKKLQDQINGLHLSERIHLLPTSINIFYEYQRSQFLVLTSDFEGFGLVIVEAMACGVPVVATDCPFGPSEIIDDGKTGLLAKMDVKDLADKMEWMMTHDKERESMGVLAYEAVARYRKELVIPEWEKAYMSVIV